MMVWWWFTMVQSVKYPLKQIQDIKNNFLSSKLGGSDTFWASHNAKTSVFRMYFPPQISLWWKSYVRTSENSKVLAFLAQENPNPFLLNS